MNLQATQEPVTWSMQQLMADLPPPQNVLSTVKPSPVENLPSDIATIVVKHVFKRSKRDYGALLQTCKTIYISWNSAFFVTQKKLSLYRTLMACSGDDDARVSAIFERVYGNPLRFHKEQQLEIALTNSSSETSLSEICAHFPSCVYLTIVDKRTVAQPQALIRKELVEKAEAAIASAVNVLDNVERLTLRYHKTQPLSLPTQLIASMKVLSQYVVDLPSGPHSSLTFIGLSRNHLRGCSEDVREKLFALGE